MKRTEIKQRCQRCLRLLMAGGVSLLVGCSGHRAIDTAQIEGLSSQSGSAVLEIEAMEYERVFEAARSTLMEHRFSIDRVDARRGVITTHPKRTNGLASPWDREQSSLGQEWEDLINEQQRVVRIEFDRPERGAGGESDGESGVGSNAGTDAPATMRVLVELYRTHRPNWRVQSESVRLSTHARSRDELGQREPGQFSELVGLDPRFAARVAESIRMKLGLELTDAAGAP